MKKSLIIYTLLLSTFFFVSFSLQAQQQKKPSERSFTAEIEKVKQIQAARKTMLRQTQQPVESTPATTEQPGNEKLKPANNTNFNAPKESPQPNVTTKPSGGAMKLPKKPAVSKG